MGTTVERAGFSSLALRLATLPLVICGPILRRTEEDKVSVWIAFRRAVSDIQLRIYDSPNPDPQATPLLVSARTETFALGDNLFVALVTADQGTTPVIRLSPQQIYGYDVILGSEGDVGLGDPGILNAPGNVDGEIGRIAYGTYALPSFVIPASTVAGLKLVHGSCRMPHGGKTDGLRALDSILNGLHADPVNRPQQLFLTGDQIYADDVADPLLHMLIDAESALLGWLEPLPGNPPADGLRVGHRSQTVRDAGFTTTAGKSHLIRLGEYYAMYLMVWSDVLWPDDPPGFAEVHPDLPTHEVRGVARAGTIRVETKKYAGFNRERSRIVEFRRSLGFARKALANIASYMVFDDHEVTDDWFLEGGWSQRVIAAEPLTRRIVQNGLSAFGVFQAWGNLPTEFGGLLQRLATVHSGRGLRVPDWAAVGAGVLPVVATDTAGRIELTGGPRWNYVIEFEAHRLIALDTRTRRSFARANGPPCLVGGVDLATQIPLPGSVKELTVLVSGAPVVGHPLLEEVVQPITRVVKDPGYADYEFWTGRRDCFEALLDRLTPLRRVLMLSGDVHYGFSVAVHYWNKRTGTTLPAVFVQLCSSALSNEDGKTNLIANKFLKPDMRAEFVGWNTPGRHVTMVLEGVPVVIWVSGKPAVHQRMLSGTLPVDQIRDPGDWSYRVLFERDGRTASQRGVPGFGSLPVQPQERLGYQHRWRQKWEAHRTVVGRDNFGAIFIEDFDGTMKVFHELWYAPENPATSLLLPYTRHAIELDVPPVNGAPS
ncbi:hypothetical protein E0H75_22265 [Kribbella capetownensis]|uniref:PhoD-like phosphatase metallophosphatase domain-containing protein n=1 Tax=Kribbella capetownensis TaxID=1572659 RepID=A0A4R0JYN4_9ACTN|nr:hypothetical protein [Kribbella capetownensis]TCC47505.1 hypothetical protein E0H75_22265 [Kribbella capetownensis]